MAGLGGAVPVGDPPVYVTGAIILDGSQDLAPGFGRGYAWGSVLLHEVGHLVGLGHVDDDGEVMEGDNERSTIAATLRWGVGDREGLRRLGLDAGCQRVRTPPAGR